MRVIWLAWLIAAASAARRGAWLRPRCVSPHCKDPEMPGLHVEVFVLYGRYSIYVKFKENEYFLVECKIKEKETFILPFDDPAMPALPEPAAVDRVAAEGCGAPAAPYARALRALNVSLTSSLQLVLPAPGPPLTDTNLHGLTLSSLDLRSSPTDNKINLTGSIVFEFLNKSNIRILKLYRVILDASDLMMFPDSLETLSLTSVAFDKEPSTPHWLERLPALASVEAKELDAPLVLPLLSKLPRLTTLSLNTPLARPLPHNWLSGSAVTTLTISNCGLQKLPEYMFGGVNLTNLILRQNDLTELPKDISSLIKLTTLDVSTNRLQGAALWRAVAALSALEVLFAAWNPLGAACPEDEGLSMPRSLQNVYLMETFSTRVCGAWRALPALQIVDLSSNNISAVSYKELKGAARGVLFNLSENPQLHAVSVDPSDVDDCRQDINNGIQTDSLQLSLDALRCDCSNEMFRELVAACAVSLLGAAACARRRARSFLQLQPRDMVCACPDNYSIPGCSCEMLHNATVMQCSGTATLARWPAPPPPPGRPLVLRAPAAALTALPALPLAELHAANNSIQELRAADITDSLMLLDLRNNNISHMSVETARRLGAARRRSWLAGNPLACACAHRDSLALLHTPTLRRHIEDWKDLRCSDGRELSAITPSDLCFNWPLLTIMIVAFVTTSVISAQMLWRYSRLRPVIKGFLLRFPLCVNWVLQPEDSVNDPKKDKSSFISYAIEDREIANKLIQRLEQRGYSTLEHSRDWMPGVPIAEQITESVQRARRTVLLVTDSYARSPWALQELRAAHAHALAARTARVVPVLCGVREPAALPPVLRLYLRNNTYLSWDDPDFWDKLWLIMPPVPPPAAPAPDS